MIHIGLTISLHYKNPYLSPAQEFQRFKMHPYIRGILDQGTCLEHGARTLTEGGFFSVPHLHFPGGLLTGCAAGFMNTAKLKGTHTAIKTGILAAESIHESQERVRASLANYSEKYRRSWVWEELHSVKDYKVGFSRNAWIGLLYNYLSYPKLSLWNFTMKAKGSVLLDSDLTEYGMYHKPIQYPPPDDKTSFDTDRCLSLSRTSHDPDQPNHIKIRSEQAAVFSYSLFKAPETRVCPTGVFEFESNALVMYPSRCIQCKACDIKSPAEYIQWTPPEGGNGPS